MSKENKKLFLLIIIIIITIYPTPNILEENKCVLQQFLQVTKTMIGPLIGILPSANGNNTLDFSGSNSAKSQEHNLFPSDVNFSKDFWIISIS